MGFAERWSVGCEREEVEDESSVWPAHPVRTSEESRGADRGQSGLCVVQVGSVRDLEAGDHWASVRIWCSEKKSRPL